MKKTKNLKHGNRKVFEPPVENSEKIIYEFFCAPGEDEEMAYDG